MNYKLTARSIYELGQRTNQEDSIFPPFSPEPKEGSLYILCDGMGGHAAGEVASQTVCETMSRYIAEHPREDGYFDEDDFYEALDAAYDALDAKDTDDEKKMGTTLTFVKFHTGGCFIAHIGDSRIYHIRPSEHRILHVTRDHSLVNDLIKLGELTPEEARTSRQKNVITRAVQPNQESRTKADCLNITDLEVGDYFYMCSDGMLEQAEDEEIVNILSLGRSDAEKIEILRGATKNNKDNHSAHLIRIVGIRDEKVTPVTPVPPVEEEAVPHVVGESASEQEQEYSNEHDAGVLESERSRGILKWALLAVTVGAIAAIAFFWGFRGHKEDVPKDNELTTEISPLAPEPEPEAKPEPEVLGVIKVISTPSGATVWLDGKSTNQKTPVDLKDVTKGQHKVKLVKDNYKVFEKQITVTPPYTAAISCTLVPVKPADKPVTPVVKEPEPETKVTNPEPETKVTNPEQKATKPDTTERKPIRPREIGEGTVDPPVDSLSSGVNLD